MKPILKPQQGESDVKMTLEPRPVRDSQSEMAEIVLPNDANPLGALLGGRLMHWIDLAGAMAAHRHSRNYVVTASVDHIDFLVPVRVGDLVILRSSVNRVFHTSMEVGVKVYVENYIADTAQHVASAHLTFVAIDAAGSASKSPPSSRRPRNNSGGTTMRDGGARSAGRNWKGAVKSGNCREEVLVRSCILLRRCVEFAGGRSCVAAV